MTYRFRSMVDGDVLMLGPAEPDAEAVSLRQRAWPLVEMMRRAHAADAAIV